MTSFTQFYLTAVKVRSFLTFSVVALTFVAVCCSLTSSVLFRRLFLVNVRVVYLKFAHLLNECILTSDIWTFIYNYLVPNLKFFTWHPADPTWFKWAAILDYAAIFFFPSQTFYQLADVISVMAIHLEIQIFNLLFPPIHRFNVADTLDTWLKPNAWLWILYHIFIIVIVTTLAAPEWFFLIHRILHLKKLVGDW